MFSILFYIFLIIKYEYTTVIVSNNTSNENIATLGSNSDYNMLDLYIKHHNY